MAVDNSQDGSKEPRTPFCTFVFFDCLNPSSNSRQEKHATPKIGGYTCYAKLPEANTDRVAGVEREMKVLYQQPHLVPPMKLTVYDEMPSTPGLRPPSAMARVVTQGKTLASKASERASLSVRRRPNRRRIGAPQTLDDGTDGFTYRPLELSIYISGNRLSDLPEFDAAEFEDDGSLALPPKALLRAARSEEALGSFSRVPSTRRVASMCIDRKVSHKRTASSIISSSRPPSEYDALHSHPVSMISAPGQPTQIFHHPVNSITVLSPIKDEFTPPSSALLEKMMTDFPKIEDRLQAGANSVAREPMPASAVHTTPLVPRLSFQSSRANSTATNRSRRPTTASSQNFRVAQWVHRGHASSGSVSSNSTMSTMASASTSFSEHRRKRKQFYQCKPWNPNQDQSVPVPTNTRHNIVDVPPPVLVTHVASAAVNLPVLESQPLKAMVSRNGPTHVRTRTMSSSTVASTDTVDTNILSLDQLDGHSDTSVSTAPVVQDIRDRAKTNTQRTRTGTMRSFSKPLVSHPAHQRSEVAGEQVTDRPSASEENTESAAVPTQDAANIPSAMKPVKTNMSVEDLMASMPAPPPYVETLPKVDGENFMVIKEIGGPLRSPGVGVAF